MGDYPNQMRSLASSTRQPPYSIEFEQNVLGGMALDNRCIDDVAAVLVESDFYRADHQLLFRGVLDMHAKRRPVDMSTLTEYFRQRELLDEVGGLSYIGSLCNDVPSVANVLTYARGVRDRSVMRSLVAAGGDIAEMGYRPDGREIDELIAEAQKQVMALSTGRVTDGDPVRVGECIAEWHEEYFSRKSEAKAPGLQTGFRSLDNLLIGLEPGDLMIAAGATGMGKTVFGLTIAEHVARVDGAVLGFSLEMPKRQWLTRLVASRGRVPLHRLRDPRQTDVFDDDQVSKALGEINRLPFYISDYSGQTIHQVRSRAMRLHAKVPLKLILIDYVQLVAGDRRQGDSRTNEMDSVSRGLKSLAKEIGVPVLALAQINNKVTERDNKRPRLSDLRESGGITQDADIVCLLYRDEYYNRKSPHTGIVEVDVAKQRNGKLEVAELEWQGGYCAMDDYCGPSASEREAAAAPPKPDRQAKKTGLAGMVNGVSA